MDFEQMIYNKLVNDERIDEDELSHLVYEYDVHEEAGEDGRWDRQMFTIVKLKDKYFAINWQKGLTEMQEDSFFDQPYEVEKSIEVKTIEVINWNKK